MQGPGLNAVRKYPWDVEFSDEFGAWWDVLTGEEQESIAASVGLLEAVGPNLKHPHSSGISGSKHGHMRELRTQHEGRPYRTLRGYWGDIGILGSE